MHPCARHRGAWTCSASGGIDDEGRTCAHCAQLAMSCKLSSRNNVPSDRKHKHVPSRTCMNVQKGGVFYSRRDSNPQSSDPKSDALSITPRELIVPRYIRRQERKHWASGPQFLLYVGVGERCCEKRLAVCCASTTATPWAMAPPHGHGHAGEKMS